jgi:hypothetical protein
MKLAFALLGPTLLMVVAIGCSKTDQTAPLAATPPSAPSAPAAANSGTPGSGSDTDLIRQAVEDHVRNDHGINLSAMDMSVDSVKVDGDKAQASATFRVKQGGTSMAMIYDLERHGNGWIVLNGKPSDGQFVHPPMDKAHSPTSSNPSGQGMPDVRDFLKSHPAPDSN